MSRGESEPARDERLRVVGERLRGIRLHRLASSLPAGDVADQIDLHQRVLDQQTRRADGRARRRRSEIFFPYLVEGKEVAEIGQEYLCLEHVVEGAAGRLERLLRVFQNVTRLQLYVGVIVGKIGWPHRTSGNAGLVVTRDLPGGKNEVVDPEAFVVMRERARCPRFDDLFLDSFARYTTDEIDLD